MAVIDFPKHFALVVLAFGLLLLWVAFPINWNEIGVLHLPFLQGTESPFPFVAGAIHAAAFLLATSPYPNYKATLFILLTIAANFIAVLLGFLAASYMDSDRLLELISAVGAFLYAILIAVMWLPRLVAQLVLVAVPVCTVATIGVSTILGASLTELGLAVAIGFWWLAFSLSTWLVYKRAANKSLKADAVNGAA